MLDISDPSHARTLRQAATALSTLTPLGHEEWRAKLRRDAALSPDAVLVHECVEALSSPAETIVLLRRLLERIGLRVYFEEPVETVEQPSIGMSLSDRGVAFEYWVGDKDEPVGRWVVPMDLTCLLIARLLRHLAPDEDPTVVRTTLKKSS